VDSKHYEMIGAAVRRHATSERALRLNDIELGKMMYLTVKVAEQEAERDARDKANGKGE
jgi:hypothetical protein